ncbi:glutamine--tRNA ligase/YqeY domain fusion protein [Chlamydiota bacterium]
MNKTHFIHEIIKQDISDNKNEGKVHTRFPPEPNGYLHIGHAKSICLNFSLAKEFNGICNLRFDDTNPVKEEQEYIVAIKEDVNWLGFNWKNNLFFASDYFERMYQYALELIEKGKAYVCDLSNEEIRKYRGTLTEQGKNSPFRNRSIEENLDLFNRMKQGLFPDGARVLRARIDMTSPNITMRDPVLYRILHQTHHRTGEEWCLYPLYDFAHCLSDAIERITHSICTLEFEDHRPLYDWILDQLETSCHPQQIEFARLNMTNTILSKRKLSEIVKNKYVSGWNDPRLPTISGLRRRGYTPEAIRTFCERIGVAKTNSVIDISLLEHCLREDLNKRALRVMGVLRPLKVVILNYPKNTDEFVDAINNPEDERMGTRKVPFSRILYIDQEDFKEDPPRNYFRLAPGREVRLKHAYYIRCTEVIKDNKTGKIVELHCEYDPQSFGGWTDDGRKVKGTLHWVSVKHALPVEVRLFDYLITEDASLDKRDWKETINPHSRELLYPCYVEPFLNDKKIGQYFQFLRQGYFCLDTDSSQKRLVFNQTIPLRDSWAKQEKKNIL